MWKASFTSSKRRTWDVVVMMMAKNMRKRITLSSIGYPFKFFVSHIKTEYKNLKKEVEITSFNFKHNHKMNKKMMIKAKMIMFQHIIPPGACHTMLNLIQDGPIHTHHIRSFLKRYYPNLIWKCYKHVFDISTTGSNIIKFQK